MKVKYLIVGSGIGGMSAGAHLKSIGENDFIIVDRAESLPRNLSNGVHYLHSDNFGTPFPFEFKKITATEEVWDPRTDTFKDRANIPEMMAYSLKVMGTRHPSSIMDPGNRNWDTYLPVSNNMDDLIQAYYDYIGEDKFAWSMKLNGIDTEGNIAMFDNGSIIEYSYMITTAPMPDVLTAAGLEFDGIEFKNTPVYITNYKADKIVANWLLGLYVSDPNFPPYRITILNNIISMESVKELTKTDEEIVKYHLGRYFDYDLQTKSSFCWNTGRIFGLTKEVRKYLVQRLVSLGIYPVGRFGLWNGKLIMDSTAIQARGVIDSIQNNKNVAELIDKLSG